MKAFDIKTIIKGRCLVVIDAANLELSVRDLGTKVSPPRHITKGLLWKPFPKGYFKVDYKKLKNFFITNGHPLEIRFYSTQFQTDSHNQFLAFLKSQKYILVTKTIKDIREGGEHHRKANFDVEIAVDSVRNLNTFDSYILFSGDSDFAYLLHFLKGKGKRVIVVSQRGHVAKELIMVADTYIDIFKLKDDILRLNKQKSR